MFNEDTSLTSQAALRLYRRVMHEVGIRNSLHCITLLSKTSETQLLSEDTKRECSSMGIIVVVMDDFYEVTAN